MNKYGLFRPHSEYTKLLVLTNNQIKAVICENGTVGKEKEHLLEMYQREKEFGKWQNFHMMEKMEHKHKQKISNVQLV